MARAIVNSDPTRRSRYEPLYDVDRWTGATVETFFADRGAWRRMVPLVLPVRPASRSLAHRPICDQLRAYRGALGDEASGA